MTESLSSTVAALRDAAATFDRTARSLAALDPGPGAFGEGPGRLGDVGRDLARIWREAIDARAGEATAHAARLNDEAGAVARAAEEYADRDHHAGRRPEVL